MLKFLKNRQKTPLKPEFPSPRGLIVYETVNNQLPEIASIQGASPQDFIDKLTTRACQILGRANSPIPPFILEELITNLCHADFKQPVITIYNDGHSLSISDQGPGIADKEKALQAGYYGREPRYAIADMRGVGMGLPMVCKAIEPLNGRISITDNLGGGTVVQISIPTESGEQLEKLNVLPEPQAAAESGFPGVFVPESVPVEEGYSLKEAESYMAPSSDDGELSHSHETDAQTHPVGVEGSAVVEALSDLETKLSRRQRRVLFLVADLGEVGPSTASVELDMSLSTAFRDLVTLEEMDLVQSDDKGKRSLTPLGARVIAALTA
ncbi:MAG: hypothetical protein GX316_09315 [Firmicutes bacterium]|nr:hypothetical protein [Bacillota bacterium]